MSCCWVFRGFSGGFSNGFSIGLSIGFIAGLSTVNTGLKIGFFSIFGVDFAVFSGTVFLGVFLRAGFVVFDVFTCFALTEAFFGVGFFTCLAGLFTVFFLEASFFMIY